MIRREVPITERDRPLSRTSLYFLADNYLAFWYRYVDPGRSLIAQGLEQRVLDRVKQSFNECVSRPPFEDICRQFLWRAYVSRRLPAQLEFDAVGTWWDASHEIDVVARESDVTTLVGSCKWSNARLGINELDELRRALAASGDQLNPSPECWFALFSREGFEANLAALARQPDQRILLFSPTDLF